MAGRVYPGWWVVGTGYRALVYWYWDPSIMALALLLALAPSHLLSMA